MNCKLVLAVLITICKADDIFAQQPGTVLWTFDAPYLIRSSPAVSQGGTVYFGATGTLYAITNGGSNAWSFPTEGPSDSSPAVAADGTIYYASFSPGGVSNGCLYAINSDGSQKWRYHANGGNGSPAIGSDGTIYISGGRFLQAVSPEGTNRWSFAYVVNQGTYASPSVGQDGSIDISALLDGTMYTVTSSGGSIWSFYSGAWTEADSAAIAADGTVYFTSDRLYAFSPNGANLWTSHTNNFTGSSPVIDGDGTIYLATSGSSLCAFSPSGAFKWQVLTNAGSRAYTSPAVDSHGTIYHAAFSILYAIDPSGSVAWSLPLVRDPGDAFGTSHTSPAIGTDGTIYLASANRLYAIAGTNAIANSPWPMYRQNARHTGNLAKPSLQKPQKRGDANLQFELYAQIGQTQTIQTSTDLATWTSLTNVAVTNVPMDVIDLNASNFPSRFYRTVSQ
jgi:hypothetical protein